MLRGGGADFAAFELPTTAGEGAPTLVWAHGWGQSHAALLPVAEAMRGVGSSLLIDVPGFGASPMPQGVWGTADYADAAAEWLAELPRPLIWIGHSNGCRIGLQLAARHPELVDGLFLIAAPGLPPRRSLRERARRAVRRWIFRLLRALVPEGPARQRLRERFGSADYRTAGAMRPILVKTVSETLGPVASEVRCPTVLLYGERDGETPPDIGERLQKLIPGSELAVLRGLDHWTVLSDGQHQVVYRLSQFLQSLTGVSSTGVSSNGYAPATPPRAAALRDPAAASR